MQIPPCVVLVEQAVDMGVFGNQNHPKGIPIQPGHRVEGTLLPRAAVVPRHPIGQRPGVPAPGGVDQHPRRLIHRQNVFILIQDLQRQILRRILRLRFVQKQAHHISLLHPIVGALRDAIDQDPILPFQPVHQPGRYIHFLPQDGR